MSIDRKNIKKTMLRLLRRREVRLAIVGGVAVAVLAVAAALLFGGGEETPSLTDGNHSSITILAGGDLNITEHTASSDFSAAFLDVAELFAAADASILNFEGNFGDGNIAAPDALAQQLAAMGVDFLQTANSCAVKNGISGLTQTLHTIRENGLIPVGTYASNAEAAAEPNFVLRNISGIKVAIVAFTKGLDGMRLPDGYENCVNLLYTDYDTTYKSVNTAGITAVLQEVEKAKPDITIALVHWGSENNTNISSSQKKIAKLLQQNGVAAIIGTHSHQVQAVEFDESKGTLIAYSLGDFFGDGELAANRYSLLLELTVTKNHDTGAVGITDWNYVPIYTVENKVLQIRPALKRYENNHISKVSPEVCDAMNAALTQLRKRLSPEET